MGTILEDFMDKFNIIYEFLTTHPDRAQLKQKETIDCEAYQNRIFYKYKKEIETFPCPKNPQTTTDDALKEILNIYYGIEETNIASAINIHKQAMGAENIIGKLLERYIDSRASRFGWVWCAGSIVKAADFIRKRKNGWDVLQIKNRDNSENSSSAAIRAGTDIKKWFRTFSKRNGTNWDKFPDDDLKKILSEEDFHTFIKDYLVSHCSNEMRP